jgi:HD-GYP domain-containing protein (c-di-GMP phosphodiesterase class II)
VANSCARLLNELNIHGAEAELIVSAARVHDIGKIAVPDAILLKPGKLTPEEMRIMQMHPAHGAELLSCCKDFARGVEIVRHHHEHWCGAGYPAGLKDFDIPFGSRVIAVADSLDAMTSDRTYRKGMTTKQALQVLQNGAGTQWDAPVIDALVRIVRTAEQAAEGRGPVTSMPTERAVVAPA